MMMYNPCIRHTHQQSQLPVLPSTPSSPKHSKQSQALQAVPSTPSSPLIKYEQKHVLWKLATAIHLSRPPFVGCRAKQ